MLKAKKYDWKDSNMALFGSDTEKQVKKESAEQEPAWEGAGQEVGVRVWRIVKFQVESWPEEDYGDFYEGDSYIVLNTYKQDESDELLYDVHFWIGKYSTQDEYGTAAYKTVELDTFLDDKPVQHREVQGHESSLFRDYFKNISYMKGGADTGFRRVLPEEYTPRLLKFKKEGKRMLTTELSLKRSSLNSDDVFILDLGLTLYQWNGANSSGSERYAAGARMEEICSSRSGRPSTETFDEDSMSSSHKFYSYFKDDGDDDEDDAQDEEAEGDPVLMKVSNADGSLDCEEVVTGEINMDLLASDDVFIVDTKQHLFVWVGKGASVEERRNSMTYAHNYLLETQYPWLPVSIIAEGNEKASPDFVSSVPGCA